MSNIVKLREILVYNQPKQKFYKFQTATDKWSELAAMITSEPELEVSDLNSMRAVVQSTENTLELPNAIIPEGPQKIFLFEAKVKSGAKSQSKYDNFTYNELRRVAKGKDITGLGSNPTKSELINAIEKAAGIKTSKVSKTSPKTGRITIKTVKKESPETNETVVKDREIANIQINLNERVQALEQGLANLINGLYSACSDFVKPKHESKIEENVSISELEKDASMLKIR